MPSYSWYLYQYSAFCKTVYISMNPHHQNFFSSTIYLQKNSVSNWGLRCHIGVCKNMTTSYKACSLHIWHFCVFIYAICKSDMAVTYLVYVTSLSGQPISKTIWSNLSDCAIHHFWPLLIPYNLITYTGSKWVQVSSHKFLIWPQHMFSY